MRLTDGSENEIKVVNSHGSKETCFGCKHLAVKRIWLNMCTASCVKSRTIIPYSWSGDTVVIEGVGEFCEGKE